LRQWLPETWVVTRDARCPAVAAAAICLFLASAAPVFAGQEPPASPAGEGTPASADTATPQAVTPPSPGTTAEADAGSAAERLLRDAGAGAEADLAALKIFEAGLAARIDRAEAESAEATGRITEMTASLRSLGAGGGSADLLYDRIVGQIVDARAALRKALSALGEASEVPSRPDAPALAGMDDPALSG
jgi:hypothetical protein